jgi:glycosyltransferase involved in cell wall biosynthesis
VKVIGPSIAFVVESMKCGGAQRVASVLVNAWAATGRRVTLITFADADRDFFSLNLAVHRVSLDIEGASRTALESFSRVTRRVSRLRSAIEQAEADVVISFGEKTNVITILATLGLGLPVVVSERTDPRHHPQTLPWRVGRRLCYRLATAVVSQTEGVKNWTASFVPPERSHVIGNPVELPDRKTKSASESSGKLVVTVGRLGPEKGYDLLLEAFAKSVCPEWKLLFIGDGPERAALEQQAQRLKLTSRVEFKGHVKDPFVHLLGADMYVLSSHYEGFPNALLEAMACGLPAVSFDCQSGPSELIDDGDNGLLVEPGNVEALSNAMKRLMADADLRRTLGAGAARVVDKYSVNRILGEWDRLLTHIRCR